MAAQDKEEKTDTTKATGKGVLAACPKLLCTVLEGQSQDAKQDHPNHNGKIRPLQIDADRRQRQKRNGLNGVRCALAKEWQEKECGGTEIQQTEDQIQQMGSLGFVIILRNRQQLLTGQKGVHGHAKESGGALQRIDIRVASAGFPFGHGSPGHMEGFRKFLLGQPLLLSESLQLFVKFHTRSSSFL